MGLGLTVNQKSSRSGTFFFKLNPVWFRKELDKVIDRKSEATSKMKHLVEKINQIYEQLMLTKEDLTGKLLQRADFVAQREELDEAFEISKKSLGDAFEVYCQIQINHNYKLREQYLKLKHRSFYIDILNQMRTYTINSENPSDTSSDLDISQISLKSPYVSQIDVLLAELQINDNLESIEYQICELSMNIGLEISYDALISKREKVSQQTDIKFEQRYKQVSPLTLIMPCVYRYVNLAQAPRISNPKL